MDVGGHIVQVIAQKLGQWRGGADTQDIDPVGIQNGLFEKIDTNVVTSLDGLYDFAVNAEGYGPVFSTCRYGIMYDAAALEAAGVEAPTSYQYQIGRA